MVNSYLLSDLDIDFLLNLPEVIKAKQNIDTKSIGSVYFTINLSPSLKTTLHKYLGLDISCLTTIPMRWIKGDTHPHIDSSFRKFDKTYLVYLTDSQGELVIDGESYPMSKGNGYVFSEGLSHETIGTGLEPRLLLGPMSEKGISVGGQGFFLNPGETGYIREDSGDLQFSTDQVVWNTIYRSYPFYFINQNSSEGNIYIVFTTDITINDLNNYFICGSSNIQIGSKSLKQDGSIPIISIDGVIDYPGLIQNGISYINGNNNIYIYNLKINCINGSTLAVGCGWLCQEYFGNASSDNYIVNCSSDGAINDNGGGILGSRSGNQSSGLYITGCSSSGNIGTNSGGIVGQYAGSNGGNVVCTYCWSIGVIGSNAGGIYGASAGDTTGNVEATSCYSLGDQLFDNAGGIYGNLAGSSSIAQANNCYSRGIIGIDGGGIFGSAAASDGGTTTASNCYSSGSVTTTGTGIYGSNSQAGATQNNCYAAEGSWSSTTANSQLSRGSFPIIGFPWAETVIDSPYEIIPIGYTPYSITNISGDSSLINIHPLSVNAGRSTSPAILSGKSYQILAVTLISGGDISSISTITINNNNGIVSTTSSTKPGVYFVLIRNTGSYNITGVILTVNPEQNSNRFLMRSLFTNNAQVFYKPHSLPSGGIGTVKNSRHKSRKT